jgi:hypothetical protein
METPPSKKPRRNLFEIQMFATSSPHLDVHNIPEARPHDVERGDVALRVKIKAKDEANAKLRSDVARLHQDNVQLQEFLKSTQVAYELLSRQHGNLTEEHTKLLKRYVFIQSCLVLYLLIQSSPDSYRKLQEEVEHLNAKENERSGRINELYKLHQQTMELLGKPH